MQMSLFDSVSNLISTIAGLKPHLPGLPTRLPTVLPAAPPSALELKTRSLALKDSRITYTLKRSKRRTIGFVIDDKGLTVSAPKWVTMKQIEESLLERESWISRKSFEWKQHTEKRDKLRIQWIDGATFQYMGNPLTVRLENSARVAQQGVLLDQATLLVALPPYATDEQIKNRVQAWLQSRARAVFTERMPIYTAQLGCTPKRWGLSAARTRWGSCGSDGSIRLNWRLIHFPLDVIDYVIVHELAHLKELNHGPDFWRTVGELFPDYQQTRQWLKQFPAE
jgi:predicted metal-dependent hydrolase